ncbi:MAG TPA: hypothetical protein VGX48_12750 [Pyrinomonadaceae bacterium]|nr:hypothetical protein [Pyrinomonadaceae bacterium]
MKVCDFCKQHRQDGSCRLGLNTPKAMGCREFEPSLEKFCSDPKDFVGAAQVIQMATFFGMKRGELKKVSLMAALEESARAKLSRDA